MAEPIERPSTRGCLDLGAPATRPALEHVRVMEQAVEQRGDGGGVAEQLSPVVDRAVRGEHRGGLLVALHDEFEQVLGGGVGQLSHAQVTRELAELLRDFALAAVVRHAEQLQEADRAAI